MRNFSSIPFFRFSSGRRECDEGGLRLGDVALLARDARGVWATRDEHDVGRDLSRVYGFPVDVRAKMAGFGAVARALQNGDIAKAQITALLLRLPEPLPLSNAAFEKSRERRPSTGRPWRASEIRPLMKFARKIWNPAEMCAKFPFYGPLKIPDPTWAAGERPLKPEVGWITYLPRDLASRAKYPADAEIEMLEDGAALITLCEEPFEKDDAEGMARLHALEAALRPIQT